MNGCRRRLFSRELDRRIAGVLACYPARRRVRPRLNRLSASFRKAAERIAPAVVAVRPLDAASAL